jgi:hypothetical protein
LTDPAPGGHQYRVMVDDNFHYMDESERYKLGDFDSCESAIAACKKIVDDFLRSSGPAGATAKELWEQYTTFGEDPFILTTDPDCRFSAWDYAQQRCGELGLG